MSITCTYGKPRKTDPEHDYIVLYKNSFHSNEIIVQTESSGSRAQITVDFYNEKRISKALLPNYFWRMMTEEDKEELQCIMQE